MFLASGNCSMADSSKVPDSTSTADQPITHPPSDLEKPQPELADGIDVPPSEPGAHLTDIPLIDIKKFADHATEICKEHISHVSESNRRKLQELV